MRNTPKGFPSYRKEYLENLWGFVLLLLAFSIIIEHAKGGSFEYEDHKRLDSLRELALCFCNETVIPESLIYPQENAIIMMPPRSRSLGNETPGVYWEDGSERSSCYL